MPEADVWSELQYLTNRRVSLKRHRAQAQKDGNDIESRRLSLEIVRTDLARGRLLTRLSECIAA